MLDFINGIIDVFKDVIGSLGQTITYVGDGVSTLLSAAAPFPSFWSVLPGAYTSVIVAIIAVGLGIALLLSFLRR